MHMRTEIEIDFLIFALSLFSWTEIYETSSEGSAKEGKVS